MKMARSTGICGNGGVLGLSLYLNQVLSGQGSTGGNNPAGDCEQDHPPSFSQGCFVFPLPAGVLYMLIANIFQTLKHLFPEPLPENLQKIVEAAEEEEEQNKDANHFPLSPGRSKKRLIMTDSLRQRGQEWLETLLQTRWSDC